MHEVSNEQWFAWAVQALAQNAATRIGLYPSFVAVGHELAVDHDDAYRSFMQVSAGLLSESQREAVTALDNQLQYMTDLGDEELWDWQGVEERIEWAKVRMLANTALEVLGWDSTPPPKERGSIYISG
jgi:hypothetical protein